MKQNYMKKGVRVMLLALGLTSVTGFSQLYDFTSHTFTNASAIGKEGPVLGACQTAYAAEVWELDPTLFNMTTQGIQEWTVPATGMYEIEAYGAQGGDDLYTANPEDGGLGAKMIGTFSLTEGDVLYILVGQKGEDLRVTSADNAAPGGGGGTFVWDPLDLTAPLVAAGGGGGGSGYGWAGLGALTTLDGQNSASMANGGIGGNGGRKNNTGSSYWAGGGAGWLTNGTGGFNTTDYDYTSTYAQGGRRPLDGGIGGVRHNDGIDEGGDGGFGGGGGGGSDNMGSGGGGGYSGGGGERGYQYSGGGGGSYNAGTDQDNVAAINAGMGSVIITLLCDPITITATGTEVCDGELSNLTATAVSGATIIWDGGVVDGTDFSAPVGLNSYTASTTDTDDCPAQIDVLVYALPTVTATADVLEVCDGAEVTLTSGGDASSYSWDMGVVDGVAFAPPVGVTTYTVTGVVDTSSCENTATIDITVNELPVVTASATDTAICLGESVTLNGGGATTYVWSPAEDDGVEFTPAATGTTTYTVVGTDDNSCVNSATVDITVYDALEITYTTVDEIYGTDGEINITVTGGNPAYTFDWDNDGTGDFDDTEDLTGLIAGTYVVVVNDVAGCSATESIIVKGQVGIEELENGIISVYPNPTTGSFTVEIEGAFDYQITSINGAVLLSGKSVDKQNVSINEFANGVYFITLKTNDFTKTVKLIKK